MPVSRRLRYEVLRRDNHACRYCGAAAPEVRIIVDHVTPKALGGPDDPSNLVAACEPCNAGKTSTSPDAPLVEDVRQDALRWGRAIELACSLKAERREEREEYVRRFDWAWRDRQFALEFVHRSWIASVGDELASHVDVHGMQDDLLIVRADSEESLEALYQLGGTVSRRLQDRGLPAGDVGDLGRRAGVRGVLYVGPEWDGHVTWPAGPERPDGWEVSIWRFFEAGLPIDDLRDAVKLAMTNERVSDDGRFKYMCGCAWRLIDRIHQSAAEIVAAEDGD